MFYLNIRYGLEVRPRGKEGMASSLATAFFVVSISEHRAPSASFLGFMNHKQEFGVEDVGGLLKLYNSVILAVFLLPPINDYRDFIDTVSLK